MPEIEPLLLFPNKKVELSITEPEVPVLRGNEFKTFLRDESKTKNISSAQRDTITEILSAGWTEA
jgi:hypothetical protein